MLFCDERFCAYNFSYNNRYYRYYFARYYASRWALGWNAYTNNNTIPSILNMLPTPRYLIPTLFFRQHHKQKRYKGKSSWG